MCFSQKQLTSPNLLLLLPNRAAIRRAPSPACFAAVTTQADPIPVRRTAVRAEGRLLPKSRLHGQPGRRLFRGVNLPESPADVPRHSPSPTDGRDRSPKIHTREGSAQGDGHSHGQPQSSPTTRNTPRAGTPPGAALLPVSSRLCIDIGEIQNSQSPPKAPELKSCVTS